MWCVEGVCGVWKVPVVCIRCLGYVEGVWGVWKVSVVCGRCLGCVGGVWCVWKMSGRCLGYVVGSGVSGVCDTVVVCYHGA